MKKILLCFLFLSSLSFAAEIGGIATQPVSNAVLPLPTGAALDSSVTAMSVKLPAALGVVSSSAQGMSVVPADNTATGNITTQNLTPTASATAGSAVAITLNGATCLGVQVTGTYTGALSLQYTIDGATWVTQSGIPAFFNIGVGGLSNTISSATVGVFNVDVMGALQARITGLAAVTGTAAVSLKASATCSYQGSTIVYGGAAANGSARAGNPIGVAGRVITAIPAAMAANVTAEPLMTDTGSHLTWPYAIPQASWNYAAASGGIANTTTAVTIQAAGTGTNRNYIKACQITSGALGAATEFVIRDGAGGTVLSRSSISTAGAINGIVMTFDPPLKGTAATLAEVATLTATITGAVYVNCQGFQAN